MYDHFESYLGFSSFFLLVLRHYYLCDIDHFSLSLKDGLYFSEISHRLIDLDRKIIKVHVTMFPIRVPYRATIKGASIKALYKRQDILSCEGSMYVIIMFEVE